MDRITFLQILESCLLSYEGMCLVDLVNTYGFNTTIAETGIKLCDYLNSIK